MASSALIKDLDWSGYLNKKAFKTVTKQNWKKRFCLFDAAALSVKWFGSENTTGKPLGQFDMDPTDVMAAPTPEHDKPHEIKITSKQQVFYACTDTAEDAQKLLMLIDSARRAKIAGDDGAALIKADSPEASANSSVAPGEPGAKAFTWGVGSLLGVGNMNMQGMATPQRVNALKPPVNPSALSAGPEHASAMSTDGALYVWGSNEFRQVAAPPDLPVAFRPIQVSALSSRKVLSIACGGSHTLAVVADAGASASAGGVLVGWGTGTVGQLGLGEASQYADGPVVIPLPAANGAKGGKSPAVARAYAGLVSSAAVNILGEAFVWGDASIGRLGLANYPDNTPPGSLPMLVNAAKVWNPQHIEFKASDMGPEAGAAGLRPSVAHIALGGSFTLYMLSNGKTAGCVLLASGALGVDITRDTYGHVAGIGASGTSIDAQIDAEIKGVPRRNTPQPIAPFGTRPIVLSAYAGARHAAVVITDDTRGGAPRLYTGGKGWLGHAGDADKLLLQKPAASSFFAPVAGLLGDEDVLEAACGHSHTVARTTDGRLFAWGRGDSGELGLGNLSDRSLPAPVKAIDGHHWSQVCAGSYYTTALCDPGFGSRKSSSEVLSTFSERWAKLHSAEEDAIKEAVASAESTAPAPAPAPASAALPTANVSATPAVSSSTALPVPVGKSAVVSAPTPAPAPAPEPEPEPAEAEAAADDDALPDGWDYDYDDEGTIYFIRPDGETQWEDPRDQR